MIKFLSSFMILLSFHFGNLLFAQQLKIVSYNIHHGANKDEQLTLKEIGAFIKDAKADLVGLQEVDSMCNRSGKEDQMKELAKITGMHYAFVRHFAFDGGAYGLGVLSRYPLSEVRNDRISSKSVDGEKRSLALLSAKVTLPDNKEVRFATVHFALDQLTRMIQSTETVNYLKSDMPVILTGDLNAETENKAIKKLETLFTNTDPSAENTFPVDVPTKKIDYIMVSSLHLSRVINTHVMEEVHHSDHLPLCATIDLY